MTPFTRATGLPVTIGAGLCANAFVLAGVASAVGACEATCAESGPVKDVKTKTAVASNARSENIFIVLPLKDLLFVHSGAVRRREPD
jgi:hypothetical protein